MHWQGGNSIYDEQKTVAEVVPVSGDQPNGRALAVRQDAEVIPRQLSCRANGRPSAAMWLARYQYSSANMMVMTRSVTDRSVGSGE